MTNNAEAPKVDVFINVFGKPNQTALALLSLLQHSGRHIRKIYFQEEPLTSEFERSNQEKLIARLGSRVIRHVPAIWLDHVPFDAGRALTDDAYRLSIRYQYAWENSPCKYAFFMHNDIYVKGDIIGAMLSDIGTNAGIGEIGQCYLCPAAEFKLCDSNNYTNFRPKYHHLMCIYNTNMDYHKRRAYNLGLNQSFWEKPWPLPECRLNEWCALVDLEQTRPHTVPLGKGAPFGAFYDSGSKIGETWDDVVNLDIAVQWFRDMNHAGLTFKHFPIDKLVEHKRRGLISTIHAEIYVEAEVIARLRLKEEFDFKV